MPDIEYRHDLPRKLRQIDLLAQVVARIHETDGRDGESYRAAKVDLGQAWSKALSRVEYDSFTACEACDRPTEDYTLTADGCPLCPRCAAAIEREQQAIHDGEMALLDAPGHFDQSITITGDLPCDDQRVPNDRYASVSGDLPADTPEFMAEARAAGRNSDTICYRFNRGWVGRARIGGPSSILCPFAPTKPLATRNAIAALRSFALGVMDRADELEQAALAELDATHE